MAFIVNQAGGKSIDNDGGDLLCVQPQRIHQKSPCFIGSPDDVEELKTHLLVTTTLQQEETNYETN
jgi:fructose-1,6-bisphosphatase I